MSPILAALLAVVLAATAPAGTQSESPPAPLLVPGRPSPSDSLRLSRQERARRYYLRGRELERTGAPAAAIVSYRLALRDDPDLPDANFRSGKLFLAVDQYGEAVAAFAAEVERHPGNTEAARELGLGLSRLGEHERAVAQLELLTRRAPADGESWRALGFAYLGAGRAQDAEAALRRAVALPPPSAAAHRDLGFVLADHRARGRRPRGVPARAGDRSPGGGHLAEPRQPRPGAGRPGAGARGRSAPPSGPTAP